MSHTLQIQGVPTRHFFTNENPRNWDLQFIRQIEVRSTVLRKNVKQTFTNFFLY